MADQSTQNLPPIWKKPLDSAIHLKVYKNGDENFPGKKVTLNKRQQRTFDSWLRELSTSMKLRTGAVWRVFTPTQGHRVADFDHLEDGKMVVVAGQEKFKPLRYAQIDPKPRKAPPRNYDLVEPNRRYQVSGKYRKVETHATIIKCWANGNDTTAPRTVLLPAYRNKPESLQAVLEQVSGVLSQECCGPVEKLYMPNGIKVMSLDQITPNGHFVALRRHDRFKPAHYKETSLPNLRCSPRLDRKLPPIPRSNKTSSQSSPEHSMSSQNGSENSYSQRYRRERERARREEDQVFMAKPVKYKRSSEKTRPTDYDQDNGGVFKSKNQNNATRGARQVEDSSHTRTELPLDQRPAEIVQDEDNQCPSLHDDDYTSGTDNQEDLKGRDRRDRNRKEDASRAPPPDPEPQRQYRANAKQADSPNNREAENQARARREAEDRTRAEKARQQQEALRQKKKEKEEEKKRKEEEQKRKEEEEEEAARERRRRREKEEEEEEAARERRRRREKEEEEERMRKQELEERERREEEERRRMLAEEEEEERRRAAAMAARTSTPDDSQQQRADSAALMAEEQEKLAQEEEWAATRIQAGFRGYRDRRDMKQRKAERGTMDEEEVLNSSLQGDEPLPLQASEEEDWEGPEPELSQQEREEQERAAVKIQAGFRGIKARQEVRELRAANQEVKDRQQQNAPSRSPPVSNPSLTRTVSPMMPQTESHHPPPNNYDLNDDENDTLLPTNENHRDNQDPLDSQNETGEEPNQLQAEHAAAAKIQATFRGHQTRKELAATRNSQSGQEDLEFVGHQSVTASDAAHR